MARGTPTLGYPSRTAAIFGLRQRGKTTAEIAALVGLPRAHVMAREMSHMRARSRHGCRTVTLPEEMTKRLEEAAKGRRLSAAGLAYRLVDAILQDQLIDAVLDDRAAS